MALYSVYEPDAPPPDLVARGERLVFVKDGFSWPALFAAPLWLIYHRMWLGLAIFIGGLLLLDFVLSLSRASEAIAGWAVLAYLLLFAMEANDLRRYSAEWKGHRFVGMAFGGNREEAEVNFFKAWLPEQSRPVPAAETEGNQAAAPDARTAAPQPSVAGRSGETEIIGSFPNA